MPTARRIGLLFGLYFAQGMPYGFQVGALPTYLAEQGYSDTLIGWSTALSLPWLLKLLWAPAVDRYRSGPLGARKTWIVPLQLGIALAAVAASFTPLDTSLIALLCTVFVMNLMAATQDIAVDGLAVDLLRESELGYGNAAQVVGFKAGMLTSGGLLLSYSETIGWRGYFLLMAAGIGLALVGLILTPEPTPTHPTSEASETTEQTFGAILRSMWAAASHPASRWVALLAGTYKAGESMMDIMFKPFLIRSAGFTRGDIGLWVGTWGMGFSLAGSFVGGWLAKRRSVQSALLIAAALRVLPLIAQWALTWSEPSAEAVIAVTCAEHFFGGILTTVMFATMMGSVNREIGATHYTALASIEVLGKTPAAWAAGSISDNYGYGTVFAVGVALSIAFVALAAWWASQRPARVVAPSNAER